MNDLMRCDLSKVYEYLNRYCPRQYTAAAAAIDSSEEVILVGSAAAGSFTIGSDLDLIVVGESGRIKTRRLDLMSIKPRSLSSKSWLGSELATHTVAYGKWLKGDGEWRNNVFFGKMAIRQKCERILNRFVKIYSKRVSLSEEDRNRLMVRCFLDMQRAVLLSQKTPVPSSLALMKVFVGNYRRVIDIVAGDALLGDLGRYMSESFSDADYICALIEGEIQERVGKLKQAWWE